MARGKSRIGGWREECRKENEERREALLWEYGPFLVGLLALLVVWVYLGIRWLMG